MTDIENKDLLNYKNFETWLWTGIDNNWITKPFCNTHEGDPYMTKEEEQEWENGGDPCMTIVKIKI